MAARSVLTEADGHALGQATHRTSSERTAPYVADTSRPPCVFSPVDAGCVGLWQWWPETNREEWDNGLRRLLGVTPSTDRESPSLFAMLDSADSSIFRGALQQIATDGRPLDFQYSLSTAGFPTKVIHIRCGRAVGERGRILGFCHLADVGDPSNAQRGSASQLSYDAIVASMHGVCFADMSRRITYVNRAFLSMWGYEREEEVLGRSPAEFIDPPEMSVEAMDELVRTGTWMGELTGVRSNGSHFDVQISASLLRDANGQPTHMFGLCIDVTSRVRTERALRADRKRLQDILDSLFGFVGLYTLDGTLVFASRAPLEAAGLTPEQVLNRPFWETYWWSYSTEVQDQLRDAMRRAAGGEVVRYEVPVRVKKNELITIDVMFGPLRNERGKIEQIIGFAVDVTERSQVELALRESEQRLRLALANANQGLWDLNVASGEIAVTPEYATMLEYDPGDFVESYASWLKRLHPDDVPRVAAQFRDFVQGQSTDFSVEFRLRTRSGRWKWILSKGTAVSHTAEGRPSRVIGIHTDISAYKQIEVELRASRERLQAIVESELDSVILVDSKGVVLEINPAGLSMIEADSVEQVVGRNMTEFIVPEYREQYSENLASIFGGAKCRHEYAIVTLRGNQRWIEEQAVGLYDSTDASSVTQMLAVCRDTTEAKRAIDRSTSLIQKLRQLTKESLTLSGEECRVYEQLIRMVAALFGVRVVCKSDIVGDELLLTLVFANGKMSRNVGRVRLWVTPCFEVHATKQLNVFHQVASKFPESSFLRDYNAYSYCGVPIFNSLGQVVSVMCLLHDEPREFSDEDQQLLQLVARRFSMEMTASALRRAEEELVHVGRFSLMGEMASGIAHELNQPLAAIGYYAEGCLEAIKRGSISNDELLIQLQEIASLTNRAGQIIRRVRQFVTRKQPTYSNVDARLVLQDVVTFLDREFRNAQTPVELNLPEGPLWITADTVQIQQVFVNLLMNAVEAQASCDPAQRRIIVSARLARAKRVEIEVQDRGPGIGAADADKLFHPFFTTKPMGLGMGLKISQRILAGHGGEITFRSSPHDGATFLVFLPTASVAEA